MGYISSSRTSGDPGRGLVLYLYQTARSFARRSRGNFERRPTPFQQERDPSMGAAAAASKRNSVIIRPAHCGIGIAKAGDPEQGCFWGGTGNYSGRTGNVARRNSDRRTRSDPDAEARSGGSAR